MKRRKRKKKGCVTKTNPKPLRAFALFPLPICVWVIRLLSWHRQAKLRASATTILSCPISCDDLSSTRFTTLAMPSASQSSQQSFTMSQQSQTGRAASFNRSYNGGVDGPQIYSVCIPALWHVSARSVRLSLSRAIVRPLINTVRNRRLIRASMCTKWKLTTSLSCAAATTPG